MASASGPLHSASWKYLLIWTGQSSLAFCGCISGMQPDEDEGLLDAYQNTTIPDQAWSQRPDLKSKAQHPINTLLSGSFWHRCTHRSLGSSQRGSSYLGSCKSGQTDRVCQRSSDSPFRVPCSLCTPPEVFQHVFIIALELSNPWKPPASISFWI